MRTQHLAGAQRAPADPQTLRPCRQSSAPDESPSDLEPLAEVEGALLVVEVLHAPHPELGGLLLVSGEHFCAREFSTQHTEARKKPPASILATRPGRKYLYSSTTHERKDRLSYERHLFPFPAARQP